MANVGVAVADTGHNTAVGNASVNNVTGTQTGTSALGPASNNGSVANVSTGSARISTGDASAIGNDSVTQVNQHSNSAAGTLGGILVVQNAAVTNSGVALASTGTNTANGNTSQNAGLLTQVATAGLGLASNSGRVGNTSGGAATISTGSASAVGNKSESAVLQSANGSAGDGGDGGLVLLPQTAIVINAGQAAAVTGNNTATGNTNPLQGVSQVTATQTATVGADVPGIASNTADLQNHRDGSASITTGAAHATGNLSNTEIDQDIDPSGLVINTQLAVVANVGVAAANTGGNTAIGNTANNLAVVAAPQNAVAAFGNGVAPQIIGGAIASNSANLSNSSDGTATVSTGSASASGNESSTLIHQDADGEIDGAGAIINTQLGVVANVGQAAANTGSNNATGNISSATSTVDQPSTTALAGNTGPVIVLTGPIAATNQADVANASDGTANIHTGNASATGNRSGTDIDQDADGDVDGLGVVLNTQVGVVANVGAAQANTGGNIARGNVSTSSTTVTQNTGAGSANTGPVTIVAPAILGSSSASINEASDGTASIRTGDARAVGNQSATELRQEADGDIDGFGLVIETQIAPVINAGNAAANSGGNNATGNISGNTRQGIGQVATSAALTAGGDPITVLAAGPVAASNQANIDNASDGTAEIRTGAAEARGSVSSTEVEQLDPASVDGLGAVVHTQVGGVANLGDAQANTGGNTAVGNESGNLIELAQQASTVTAQTDPTVVVAVGPVMASNSLQSGNISDGTAKIGTGRAQATGNTSSTRVSQELDGSVNGLGLVIDTQAGGVLNAGTAVANSGGNTAIGNTSQNNITNGAGNEQTAVVGAPGNPINTLVFGPVMASNTLSATNTSDGEACVCTGDAIASGNIADTELSQDLDANVGPGAVVLTQAGGVLNLGQAQANTGQNQAFGNNSTNNVLLTQTSVIPVLPAIGGPQVANNGGNAANTSRGTAAIGTGKAHAIGNLSTTSLAQQAEADGPAFATQLGGTGNIGIGLANTGINTATGNNSTNTATLTQTASGQGIVSNEGSATNDSDGFAQIGDPDCFPEEKGPGKPGLPVTGAAGIQQEAAAALLLLLAGFGLRRAGRKVGV